MIWRWDASTSPDVAAYILAAALRWMNLDAPADEWGVHPMSQPAFTDIVQTTELSADDGLPDPPLGMALLIDVDAVDYAGNRSRGE